MAKMGKNGDMAKMATIKMALRLAKCRIQSVSVKDVATWSLKLRGGGGQRWVDFPLKKRRRKKRLYNT